MDMKRKAREGMLLVVGEDCFDETIDPTYKVGEYPVGEMEQVLVMVKDHNNGQREKPYVDDLWYVYDDQGNIVAGEKK